MNFVQEELILGGRKFLLETGKYAKQANGSIMVRYGNSVVLVTATMDDPRPGIDFLPLMVNYEERIYAIGKIPGSVTRREGRPRDAATIAARLIDRPLRPLFPKGFRHDIQVIATVLAVDSDNEAEIMAMNGASAALTISDIPFDGPIAGVKVGMGEDGFIINPGEEDLEQSPLDLIVTGNDEAVMMVECEADQVDEKTMIDAIEFGHQSIKELIVLQHNLREQVGQEKMVFKAVEPDQDLETELEEYAGDRMEEVLSGGSKAHRGEALDELKADIREHFEELLSQRTEDENELKDKMKELNNLLEGLLKKKVRSLILEKGIRPDGRKGNDIRPIWCEVGVLPRVHGSGVFTRGETQALTVATLGAVGDEQIIFGLGEDEHKRYMHHYNFPPYSVGETWPLRGPGRRDIGHGALGEKAMRAVIPEQEDFPYTLRLVSEVLESNGSTSQASICGCTLALMDAGVPIHAPVAGIAMGLMKEEDRVEILSDIQGLEDFYGDMDFKVAGTKEGITALQMDIKIRGVSREIMERALEQARTGRLHILDEMLSVLPEPRPELSPHAPSMITMTIDPEKIRYVIGPGGKMINKIIDETGVEIDIEDDGTIFILAEDQESGGEAKKMIEDLTKEVEVGETYLGKVKKVTNFGAFVEVLPNQEGLVHISKMAPYHVKKVEDILSVGDDVLVKCTGIDGKGRINLSREAAMSDEQKRKEKEQYQNKRR